MSKIIAKTGMHKAQRVILTENAERYYRKKTRMDTRTLTVKDIVQCQPLIIELRLGIMAKSKEIQMEDLQETLMEISDELGNICNELSELNSGLSTVGTMITINMLVNSRPELKDKVAPLINELIKGLEITLSGMGEENVSEGKS